MLGLSDRQIVARQWREMMSEAKHTPGPWTVDGPPTNQIVWSDPDNRVCFLAHSNGLNDDRDKANGRLIAAAPDMLEALRKIAAIEDLYEGTDWQEIEEARLIARAAITKATGG